MRPILRRPLFLVFLVIVVFFETNAQKSSFLVLGDIHYDLIEDHDMDWLSTKPDDIRQIKEYTVYTKENWDDFMGIVKQKAQTVKPPLKAIIQVGDLSEGLAGTKEKARQMASKPLGHLRSLVSPGISIGQPALSNDMRAIFTYSPLW